jgi:hypothetical protein
MWRVLERSHDFQAACQINRHKIALNLQGINQAGRRETRKWAILRPLFEQKMPIQPKI